MATSSQNKGVSKYVTLVSGDGFEFVVLREAACISKAIKKMLDGELPAEIPHIALMQELILLDNRQFRRSDTGEMRIWGDQVGHFDIASHLLESLFSTMRESISKKTS